MKQNLAVIVGTGIGGQRQLKKAIADQGFQVKSTDRQWPRDHYVHFKESYVKRGEAGLGGNLFGEGGYYRIGEDYLLIGSGIGDLVTNYTARDFLGFNGKEQKAESHDSLVESAKTHFPTARIHVVPSGASKGRGHNHLDVSVLLVPNNKLLIVDTYFGKYAAERDEVDRIGKQESLIVIRYDGSQDRVWNPLNALVLPDDNGDIAFVDDKSKSLIKLLEKNGVKTIGVSMPQHEYPAGKINCQTNTYNLEDNVTPDDLLEK